MSVLQKAILNGPAYLTGITGIVLGEFNISSAIFTVTTFDGNIGINLKNRLNRTRSGLEM